MPGEQEQLPKSESDEEELVLEPEKVSPEAKRIIRAKISEFVTQTSSTSNAVIDSAATVLSVRIGKQLKELEEEQSGEPTIFRGLP